MSVHISIDFVALVDVSVEIGLVMLAYLNQVYACHRKKVLEKQRDVNLPELRQAAVEGTLLRVRRIMMTAAAAITGLLSIVLSSGTGLEVMLLVTTTIVGGMVSATLLALLFFPVTFRVWYSREINK